MTVIDPSTNLGKLRLRCADFGDIPYLPDSVYTQTLADNNNSLPISAKICATYILGMLAFKTHRKIGLQLENWSGEAFTQYRSYLLMTVTNPNFMDISPIPYNVNGTTLHPLIKFQEDWNSNYAQITQSQQLAMDAIGSPSSSALWYWPQ
jgi:hypothetical protein